MACRFGRSADPVLAGPALRVKPGCSGEREGNILASRARRTFRIGVKPAYWKIQLSLARRLRVTSPLGAAFSEVLSLVVTNFSSSNSYPMEATAWSRNPG